MGYEVHITKKDMHFDEDGEDITLESWKEYVEHDEEMRLDGFAEARTPSGILRVEDDSLAVWTGWSKHEVDGGMAWIHHSNGCITTKNPDDEMLKKFYHIAQYFEAKVQGDEGEIYDEKGNSNWQELKCINANPSDSGATITKKWWQFWK
jgi:hypothetical protein